MARGDLIPNIIFFSPLQKAMYCNHFLSVYFACIPLEHCHFFKILYHRIITEWCEDIWGCGAPSLLWSLLLARGTLQTSLWRSHSQSPSCLLAQCMSSTLHTNALNGTLDQNLRCAQTLHLEIVFLSLRELGIVLIEKGQNFKWLLIRKCYFANCNSYIEYKNVIVL